MGTIRVGKIEIDPAKNPAVLDTCTWNLDQAVGFLDQAESCYWSRALQAAEKNEPLPQVRGLEAYTGSCAFREGKAFFLLGLPDGQKIFTELTEGAEESPLGPPAASHRLDSGIRLSVFPTDAALIDRYLSRVKPSKGPQAMGPVPRLGIGNRHSTAVWPGVWKAMDKSGFAANAIQNSVRELELLDDLRAGRPAAESYLFGFGNIASGHTGSTFEGLWVAGVLSALKSSRNFDYGADADHLQVRKSSSGLEDVKRYLRASRYYSFYTLDVSDVLNYGATDADRPSELLEEMISNDGKRRELILYHGQKRCIAGREYELGEDQIARVAGKYWPALDAVQDLCQYIESLKGNSSFDLELSIDETPAEISPCSEVTQKEELLFLLGEARRRGLPLTHIAPNFGVEKGTDYRCPDGLSGLSERVETLTTIAGEYGVILDCHSGDDLSARTRRVIGDACGGEIHFKVSPYLQILFAEVLKDYHPDLFTLWWEDTLAYAQREAGSGSNFAARCIEEFASGEEVEPDPQHALFHHFCFATIGRRDEEGQFLYRKLFYDLSSGFHKEYRKRLVSYLKRLAGDVLRI